MPVEETVADFLRHGEPVGGRRYRGDGVDDPLSEKGWQQMWRSVGDFAGWDAIVTSPMQRCSAFAAALAEKLSLPVSIEPAFREVGMGSWEGRSPQEIIDHDPEAYAAFYHDPVNRRPQGCEPLADFGRRIAQAYEATLARHAGLHVLVVAHAGVIRAALGHVLQSDPAAWYRVRVDNAGVTRFMQGEYGDRLEFHNCPGIGQDG
jgi:broad specificity phosphatase PhoE